MAKKLLIIDGDEDNRNDLQMRHMAKGYIVFSASDFAIGAETLAKNKPDLTLISVDDWGEECLSFIREGCKASPSTLFTVMAKSISSKNAFQTIRAGVADFLLKTSVYI